LLQFTVPESDVMAPIDPGGDPDAVSVSGPLSWAPRVASKPVTPVPVNSRAVN
jgi:hypothetical protein